MNVYNHPTLEAHRLACVELVQLMNADWYEVLRLRALCTAINPWHSASVDEAIQALYRTRYTVYFGELTGRKRIQDCPADYIRGFRAIAMAKAIDVDVFTREPRSFNAQLHAERDSGPLEMKLPRLRMGQN